MRKIYIVLVLSAFLSSIAGGQVSITNGLPSFSIDFSNSTPVSVGSTPASAYTAAGFESNPTTAGRLNSNAWAVTGWSNGNLAFGGSQVTASTDYTRGATSTAQTTGGFYAYTGAPASVANPTFMIQPGGSDFAPGTLTLRVQNNGTTPLISLDLQYNLYVRNDQGRSTSFNFSHSTDDVSYTPVAALDYTTTATADALGWLIVGTAPSRSTTITGLSIAPGGFLYLRWSSADVGGSGSRDELGLDDITGTATFGSSNTITTGSITGAPFVLSNCSSTASGTVDFTSVGTFSTGNTFTAQLSDNLGSFASPVSIGSLALAGVDPSGTINITIPAGSVSGSGYVIRVISDNPSATGSSSSTFTITQNGPGGCASSNTDYYRSLQSGSWNSIATWESSPDNITWINATQVPTELANTITVRNSHVVTVSSATNADQLVIQNGGEVNYTLGTFTIYDGPGNDIEIENGGILHLSLIGNTPTFLGSATANVNTGGTVRVSASGITGSGTGVNSNSFIYNHQSILDYTLLTPFSSSGVTYFPNVSATTVPIFRVSGLIGANVGGGSTLTINGIFECNGSVVFAAGGNKIFRNGIRGSGPITSIASSGKFVINGVTAELGGSGAITLPTLGLEIGSAGGTLVTLTADKTLTGDVTLLSTNTYVDLGTFDLTLTGIITGGTSTSYIKTSGLGELILNNITGLRDFPIGNSKYNPVTVNDANGYNWNARVEDAVGVSDPTFASNVARAVLRKWFVTPSTNPTATGANISFQWNDGDPSQVGALYNNSELVQIWREVDFGSPHGTDWIGVGVSQNPTGTGGGVRTASITGWTSFSPFAISNISGPLPVKLTAFNAIKINDARAHINWELAACCSKDARFEVQRSPDGLNYTTIAMVSGSELNRFYNVYDNALQRGKNYYRLKSIDTDGKISYSRIVVIINDKQGVLITGVMPNPASTVTTLTISAAKAQQVQLTIHDISGRPVSQLREAIGEGSNAIDLNIASLPNGIYTVRMIDANGETGSMRFVKQ